MNYFEWLGVLSGIVYVIFAAKGKWWCWPAGLVWVICTLIISIEGKLYSDASLQILYFGLTAFGWFNWVKNKDYQETDKPIIRTTNKEWLYSILFILIFSIIQSYLLSRFTDTDVPNIDSFTTSLSLLATWLLAKKKIENWWVWIVVNPIYIWLYHFKGYDLYAWLALFFTIMSIIGLIQWNKIRNSQHVDS